MMVLTDSGKLQPAPAPWLVRLWHGFVLYGEGY